MGSVYCHRTTSAKVHETSNPEASRDRRIGLSCGYCIEQTRVYTPLLPYWGARRPIPAARGPETESWPSLCGKLGSERQYYSLDISLKTYAAARKAWETLFSSTGDPLCKRVGKKMRVLPRNGRFAQYHLLGLLRSARHAMPALAPRLGYLSAGPLAGTRCTRRSQPKAPLPEGPHRYLPRPNFFGAPGPPAAAPAGSHT